MTPGVSCFWAAEVTFDLFECLGMDELLNHFRQGAGTSRLHTQSFKRVIRFHPCAVEDNDTVRQRLDHLPDLRCHKYGRVLPFCQMLQHAAERENGGGIQTASERFVQNQDPRFRYQRTTNGELLFLAVGIGPNGSLALFCKLE